MGKPGLCAALLICLIYSLAAQNGWMVLNSGTTANLNAVWFFDADTGLVAGDGGTLLLTTDGGQSWQPLPSGTSNNLYDLYFFDRQVGIMVGAQGTILRTTDGGQSWGQVSSNVLDHLYTVAFHTSGTGIAAGLSQTILASSDSGATWQVSQTGFFGGGFRDAQMLGSELALVGGENAIFQPLFGVSSDGGMNWQFTPFYFNNNEGRILGLHFLSPVKGFATGRLWDGSGAIAQTNDGGSSWSSQLFSQALQAIRFVTAQKGFAVGEGGQILTTEDGGITWNLTTPVQANLFDLFFVDTLVGYVVGEAGLVLKTTTGGVPVSVTSTSAPLQEFELLGNYPNPFNPETEVLYRVPNPAVVHFSLFNLRGQLVRRWIRQPALAGLHRLRWDGTDQAGRPVPSGVYLLSMQANRFHKTIKITLLR